MNTIEKQAKTYFGDDEKPAGASTVIPELTVNVLAAGNDYANISTPVGAAAAAAPAAATAAAGYSNLVSPVAADKPVETKVAAAEAAAESVIVEMAPIKAVAEGEAAKSAETPAATAVAEQTFDDSADCCTESGSFGDLETPHVYLLTPVRILCALILICTVGNIASGFSVYTYFTTVNTGAWWAAILPLFSCTFAAHGGKRLFQLLAIVFAFGACITGIVGASVDGKTLSTFNGYSACTVNIASTSICDCTNTVTVTQYTLTSTSPFYTHTCSSILIGNGFVKTLGASVAFCSLQVIFNTLLILLQAAAMIGKVRRAISCNWCVSEKSYTVDQETEGEKEGVLGLDWKSESLENLRLVRGLALLVGIFAVGQLAAGFSAYTFFKNVQSGGWWACLFPFASIAYAAMSKTRQHYLICMCLAMVSVALCIVACGVDGTSALTFNFYQACTPADPSGQTCLCTPDGTTIINYPIATSSSFFARTCADILSSTGYLSTIKASVAFNAIQVLLSTALAGTIFVSLNRRCFWWWSCTDAK